jgi:tetratricopeptide (TPR) repeat protein
MAELSQGVAQRIKSGEIPAMREGELQKDPDLARIAAFKLVTEALKYIDHYQPGDHDVLVFDETQGIKDVLGEAEKLLQRALVYYPEDFPATYLLAIVRYLQHPEVFESPNWMAPVEKMIVQKVIVKRKEALDAISKSAIRSSLYAEWESLPEKAPNERIKAETYYNLATIEYEMMPHDPPVSFSVQAGNDTQDISSKAINHFQKARHPSSDNHDLRLASTIGELAARLKRYDKGDLDAIERLKAVLNSELPDNFILKIVSRNQASPKVIRWARKMKTNLALMERHRRNGTSLKETGSDELKS